MRVVVHKLEQVRKRAEEVHTSPGQAAFEHTDLDSYHSR